MCVVLISTRGSAARHERTSVFEPHKRPGTLQAKPCVVDRFVKLIPINDAATENGSEGHLWVFYFDGLVVVSRHNFIRKQSETSFQDAWISHNFSEVAVRGYFLFKLFSLYSASHSAYYDYLQRWRWTEIFHRNRRDDNKLVVFDLRYFCVNGCSNSNPRSLTNNQGISCGLGEGVPNSVGGWATVL